MGTATYLPLKKSAIVKSVTIICLSTLFSFQPFEKKVSDFKTITIGNQTWMAENLSVSTFRNGDPIMEINSEQNFYNANQKKEAAYTYLNFGPENSAKLGKLYNGYAVMDPRGLAPEGWHIPSEEEWMQLFEAIGGQYPNDGTSRVTNAKTMYKMMIDEGWSSKLGGTVNQSSFSALPGGQYCGGTSWTQYSAFWWTSNPVAKEALSLFGMSANAFGISKGQLNNPCMISIRCVKD